MSFFWDTVYSACISFVLLFTTMPRPMGRGHKAMLQSVRRQSIRLSVGGSSVSYARIQNNAFNVGITHPTHNSMIAAHSLTLCLSGTIWPAVCRMLPSGVLREDCNWMPTRQTRSGRSRIQSVGTSRSRSWLHSSSVSLMDYSLQQLCTRFGERACIFPCWSCHLERTACMTLSTQWLILSDFENCWNLTILTLLLISVDYFLRVYCTYMYWVFVMHLLFFVIGAL